jgi:hypothetical protein
MNDDEPEGDALETPEMLMALEEMPPWTGYMTILAHPIFDDGDLAVAARLDDSVHGAYLLAIFFMVHGDNPKYDVYVFAQRKRFLRALRRALIGSEARRWVTTDTPMMDELRTGLVKLRRDHELARLGREDYHFICHRKEAADGD